MVNEREEFATFKAQLPEMKAKLERIDKMADKCDPRMLDAMAEMNIFVDKNRKFKASREWRILATDVNTIKTDIMDHCICPRRR